MLCRGNTTMKIKRSGKPSYLIVRRGFVLEIYDKHGNCEVFNSKVAKRIGDSIENGNSIQIATSGMSRANHGHVLNIMMRSSGCAVACSQRVQLFPNNPNITGYKITLTKEHNDEAES